MKLTHYLLLSVLSAVAMGFAFYPGVTGVLMLAAMVPLFWIEEDICAHPHTHRPVLMFLLAWHTFVLWNLIALWWAGKASFGGAVAVIVINGFLYAVVFWLFHLSKRKFGPGFGYAALFFYWLAFEYLHSQWVIAMPWLKLGQALGNDTSLIQWYDATGSTGGTAWIIMVNVMLMKVLHYWITMRTAKGSIGNLLILLALVIAPVSISLNRNIPEPSGPEAEVVVVQPNINTWSEKFDPAKQEVHINRFLRLARDSITTHTQLVVGPETLITGSLWQDSAATNKSIQRIQEFVNNHQDMALLTGAMSKGSVVPSETSAPFTRKKPESDKAFKLYNSAVFLQKEASPRFYNKQKLLAGIETMPFARWSKNVNKLMPDLGGTSGLLAPGNQNRVFEHDSLRVAPLICWESVFGNYTGRFVLNGANLLAVIANDGWWKDTPGYKMHLMFSRIRAIEHRRYVVRAANTGISAVITPAGTIADSLGWGREGALRSNVRLNKQVTYYGAKGAFAGRMSAFFSLLLLLYTAIYYFMKEH